MMFKTMSVQVQARHAIRRAGMATASTGPRMKAYAPTAADHAEGRGGGGRGMKSMYWPGNYVPVYVAVGMIALALGLGAHTMKQQLMHAPGVTVKKSKRHSMQELAEPDQAVAESDNLIRKSFFRKVAHVQEVDDSPVVPDSMRGDIYTKKPRAETLKDVGVDPKAK